MELVYTAYESNLNIHQVLSHHTDAKIIGVSVIKDYQLLFKVSKTGSYLTIKSGDIHNVLVAVWKVSAIGEKVSTTIKSVLYFI